MVTIKGSKPPLTAATLSPMSFARIQVVDGLTTKATPVAWYAFIQSVVVFFLFPAILTNWAASSQKKYECCLDNWEGRCVWLRGPFEAGMHDMTVFHSGKVEDKKKIGIKRPYIFRLNRVIELLEIVDMKANQARLW